MSVVYTNQFEYIGKRLKEERKKQGITQKELAKKLGYTSNGTIVQIEKGITKITVQQLQKFCKALNISFDKFSMELNTHQNRLTYLFVKMCNTILEKPFTLEKVEKERLIKLANDYYFKNKDQIDCEIEENKKDGLVSIYNLPFNISSENKYLLHFCFNNEIITVDYITCMFPNENFDFSNISDNEILEYLINQRLFFESETDLETAFPTMKKFEFSKNKNIQNIQKEIINITTEIDNIDTVEDIRDIAQLKLNKIKK